jgi:hypothetical protein
MPDILDLALRNRIVEFSDQLDREGYSRSEQLAVLGGLIAINLGMISPEARRLACQAHLIALSQTVPELATLIGGWRP